MNMYMYYMYMYAEATGKSPGGAGADAHPPPGRLCRDAAAAGGPSRAASLGHWDVGSPVKGLSCLYVYKHATCLCAYIHICIYLLNIYTYKYK